MGVGDGAEGRGEVMVAEEGLRDKAAWGQSCAYAYVYTIKSHNLGEGGAMRCMRKSLFFG